MAFEWTDTLGPFLGATDRAIQSGLIAAAEVYIGRVKEKLLHGYTSGAFVTGNNVNHVERDPECTATNGGFSIAVGSTQRDPDYPLFWELGHINVFLAGKGQFGGGYVRIPVWEPTFYEMHQQLEGIIAEEIKAIDG